MDRPIRKTLTQALSRLVARAPEDLVGRRTWALEDWFRKGLRAGGFEVAESREVPVRLFRSYDGCPEQVLVDAAVGLLVGGHPPSDPSRAIVEKALAADASLVAWEDTVRVVGPDGPGSDTIRVVQAFDEARSCGCTLPEHGSRPGGALPHQGTPLFGAPAALDYFDAFRARLAEILYERHARFGWYEAHVACPYMAPAARDAFLGAVREAYAGCEVSAARDLRITWGEDPGILVLASEAA